MEVAGIEPATETASPERLRVYLAFDLGRSTPTKRAYPLPSVRFGTLQRPSGEPCSVICYIMPRRSADIGASTCGLLLRRQERNRCSQLLFFSFFTWPTRIHDAQPDLNTSRRNRITPKLTKQKKSRQRPTLARASPALPSAMERLTSVFGMGTGMAASPWPPAKMPRVGDSRELQRHLNWRDEAAKAKPLV